jgi:hypothetical protein
MLKIVTPMKIIEDNLEKMAKASLLRCLEEVPFAKVEILTQPQQRNGDSPDWLVRVRLPDGKQNVVVEAKSRGEPAIARNAVNQLIRYTQAFPGTYGIFMAPYISPRSAQICAHEGVGYIDFAGNCRLAFGQVYIQREGKPNPFSQKRDLRSLYSPKATRILRVLLAKPRSKWKVQELSYEANVSLGQVFNVKKLLVNREWAIVEKDGFQLSDPATLLQEWAENYSYKKNEARELFSLKPLADIEGELGQVCEQEGVPYALTGFSGAARWSSFVRYQRAAAYAVGAIDEIAHALGLKEVESGANISLLTPYDEGVLYGAESIDGVRIALPVQCYLDLIHLSGRGQEAAETLLEQVIKPEW